MGSCCAAETKGGANDSNTTLAGVHSDCTMANYDDWAESLIKDLGSDATAIPRDFPRMDILIVEGGSSGKPKPSFRQPEGKNKGKGNPTYEEDPDAALKIRRDRVIDSLVSIVGLIEDIESGGDGGNKDLFSGNNGSPAADRSNDGPPPVLPLTEPKGGSASLQRSTTTVGSKSDGVVVGESSGGASLSSPGLLLRSNSAWSPPVSAVSVRQAADEHVKPDQSDLSHSLVETFLAAGLTVKNPEYLPPDPTGHQKVVRTTIQKRPYLAAPGCLAFDALQCFSQAVMFYPSQYLKRQLWMPWGQHLQDLGWTGTVFRRPRRHHHAQEEKQQKGEPVNDAGNDDALVVWHEQTLRNHLGLLEEDDLKHTPQFRISWRLEIVLVHRQYAPREEQIYAVGGGGEDAPEGDDDAEHKGKKLEGSTCSSSDVNSSGTGKGHCNLPTTNRTSSGGGHITCCSGIGQLKAGFVQDVNLIVTSWEWVPRLDADGVETKVTRKPSDKYKKNQAIFERKMYHSFGLAPGEVNDGTQSGNNRIEGAGDEPPEADSPAKGALA